MNILNKIEHASIQFAPVHLLICAAGVGARAGGDTPKQYQNIQGLPLLWHTLQACVNTPELARIHVVIAPEDAWFDEILAPLITQYSVHDRIQVWRVGGASRAESVLNGLAELDAWHTENGIEEAWVMVHDAARPCIQAQDIVRLRDQVWALAVQHSRGGQPWQHAGGILARPITDTIKYSADGTHIKKSIDRAPLWGAQTPQMFVLSVLFNALSDALNDESLARNLTDEASVMEWAGHPPILVEGDARNIKVTYPHDFALAEFYLSQVNEDGC